MITISTSQTIYLFAYSKCFLSFIQYQSIKYIALYKKMASPIFNHHDAKSKIKILALNKGITL
jgi:hypothetical protein